MSQGYQLDFLDHFPPELACATQQTLETVFPNPTLISVEGERAQPLFVSLMLHGNETTSFDVLKSLDKMYRSTLPPRRLLIFVGNVRAVSRNVRFLPDQPDYNRIWSHGASPEHALAAEVIRIARKGRLFASIDIHNNTGANPVYGCINTLRAADLFLANQFAPIGVYYQNPSTTQSVAFSHFCPAITIECGRNGDSEGFAAAMSLLERVMRLDQFPVQISGADDFRLFETVGRVVVDPDCNFDFVDRTADLKFPSDLEALNFTDLPAGFALASVKQRDFPLKVLDEHDTDLTAEFLRLSEGEVLTTRPVIPSMITQNKQNILQDCLCYFMNEMTF